MWYLYTIRWLRVNSMDDFFMSQVVLEPTRYNKSVLDLVLTNHSGTIHNISVERTLLSDHDMVLCDLSFRHSKTRPNSLNPTHPFDKMDLHKANWAEIKQDLSRVDWSFILSSSDIKAAWQKFEDIVSNTCSKHSPTKPAVKNNSRLPRAKQTLIRKINLHFDRYLKIRSIGV